MSENIDKLIKAAKEAYKNAYAPYSKFNVGSAILDENGNIHIGCNVENAAYPSGSCAEEQAIGNMIVNGGKIIKEIVVIGKSKFLVTPCGACRQRIREFCDKETLIHICDFDKGLQKSFSLDELLAYSFGPENL
ncbi:cytidine deaminase [Sulfurospirillum sp. 1307]|jgi:cytidine deaminase